MTKLEQLQIEVNSIKNDRVRRVAVVMLAELDMLALRHFVGGAYFENNKDANYRKIVEMLG